MQRICGLHSSLEGSGFQIVYKIESALDNVSMESNKHKTQSIGLQESVGTAEKGNVRNRQGVSQHSSTN